MSRAVCVASVVGALCLSAVAAAAAEPEDIPVFPGAAGFGSSTPAGRGGRVIRVTTLAAEGEGSLRAALEAEGKRTIVFEVAGVIDLGRSNLRITHPFVTVAGQTAPSPGVTIIGGGLKVRTHDVLIRHLKIRPGDKGGKGWEPDAINIGGDESADVFNVIVDHCSLTWAIDECASVSGAPPKTREATYSHCIIAEGLSRATHSKGEHSKGTLIHDGVRNVSLIANLYAHNVRRNPYVKSGTATVIVNNVIYNPGQLALHISRFGGKNPELSVAGNVMIAGPDTPDALGLISSMGGRPLVYHEHNLAVAGDGSSRDILTRGGKGEVRKWNARIRPSKDRPVWAPRVRVMPPQTVPQYVLATAGARPRDRDAADERIVESVRKGRGGVIDSQEDVGGHPDVKPVRRELKLPGAPNGDADGDGYTNLEEWLHAHAAKVE